MDARQEAAAGWLWAHGAFVVAVGIAAGALVLLASETDVARSTGRTAAGLCAILACIAVLAALARRSASPLPSRGASSRADEA